MPFRRRVLKKKRPPPKKPPGRPPGRPRKLVPAEDMQTEATIIKRILGSSPLCYGYIRVSTEEQALGVSLEAQRDILRRYFETIVDRYPGLQCGDIVVDTGASAWIKSINDRPGGRGLNASLQKGDHVMFPRMDRGFRSTLDFCRTWESWRKRGITMHFADQQLDLETANGKAFAGMSAVISQWESDMKSERLRVGLRAKRKFMDEERARGNIRRLARYRHLAHLSNWFLDGQCPQAIWWQKKKAEAWTRSRQVRLRYVCYMRENTSCTNADIAEQVELMTAKRERRKPDLGPDSIKKLSDILSLDYCDFRDPYNWRRIRPN
jgi:DNA invertase Pin-like site-specific DNA recombinase